MTKPPADADDTDDGWTMPKGWTDAQGRPELFMHPDIAGGNAGFRLECGERDERD